MVKEEEKVVFVCELDKLQDEYRKCKSFSLRQQIREDISLLQKAIRISDDEKNRFWQ